MKSKFSSIVMVLVMVVCGSPGVLEAMVRFTSVLTGEAVQSAGTVATKRAAMTAGKNAALEGLESVAKSFKGFLKLGFSSSDDFAKALTKNIDGISSAFDNIVDDLVHKGVPFHDAVKIATKQFSEMSEGAIKSFDNLTGSLDVVKQFSDDIIEGTSQLRNTIQQSADLATTLRNMEIPDDQIRTIVNKASASKEALGSTFGEAGDHFTKFVQRIDNDAITSFTEALKKGGKSVTEIDTILDDVLKKSGEFAHFAAIQSDEFVKGAANQADEFLEGVAKESDNTLKSMSNKLKNAADQINGANVLDDAVEGAGNKLGGRKDLTRILKETVGLDDLNAKRLADDMVNHRTLIGRAKNWVKSTSVYKLGVYKGLDDVDDAIYKGYQRTLMDENSTLLEKKFATKQMQKLDHKARSFLGRAADNFDKYGGLLKWAGVGLAGGVLFMLPSIFEQSFKAEQYKNASLAGIAGPIQFGNVVLQIPDSAINMTEPLMSQFVYYGIPVDRPGANLSAQARAAYPGVSNPTVKNKITSGATNQWNEALTLGTASKYVVAPRYNLSAEAMASLPLFVSYSPESWNPWGAAAIIDPLFTQILVNLNTGYVFYGNGGSNNTPPAPLLGSDKTTVQGFMDLKLGQLTTSGSRVTYKDYVDVFKSSKGNEISSPLANQFNCKCLQENNGVLSADTVKLCSIEKNKTCLLTKALNQLAAGLVINSQGQEMTADQDLQAELEQGALGQVIPIQGLGDQFDDLLRLFPGAEQNAIARSGVLTVSLGTDLSAPDAVRLDGADPDNYAAKGVYVYQCKNTPLAKVLKSQSGGSATTSYNDQITDFIVFLDQNLNQVPMMAPMQDPKDYHFMRMGLNPEIAYVSTIVGNIDENGYFNFLPQLNIQSPASLVAKGLPATFPPLYSLKAANGSLGINYNQNLSAAVGAVAQGLEGYGKLGQQYTLMKSAMLRLLGDGPYGKYKLSPIEPAIQPMIGNVVLALYSGYNGFPVSQGAENASCSDILIPLSDQGKTVTLPSDNVVAYYGLVTDISYDVAEDGTISVAEGGLDSSPLTQVGSGANVKWQIDQSQVGEFFWMSQLTAMGKGSDPNFALSPGLVNMVRQNRSAWVNWVNSVGASPQLSNQEFAGVTVPGTSTVLTIADQQALTNRLYIYTCSPSPSNLPQDFFVLTNSNSPAVSDRTLGSMSAASATSSTKMLSLVSGMLYTTAGDQVKNSAGVGYSISAQDLLLSINRVYPQGLSNSLKMSLNVGVAQASSSRMAMQYPFNFGGLQLGIYQADLDRGTYLYFDAAGAGTSASFIPQDYFVTVPSLTSSTATPSAISSATQYIVSLVTGQVYGSAGVVAQMSSTQLASVTRSVSAGWRSGVAAQITELIKNYAVVKSSQAAFDKADSVESQVGGINWTPAQAAAAVARVAALDYLPEELQKPYQNGYLKQDNVTGGFVVVSPADGEGSVLLYTFFDVPNSYKDDNGQPVRVGVMYDQKGAEVMTLRGVVLQALLDQYGVAVDASGRQVLGASNSHPVFKIDPSDINLQPGQSGKSMICSSNAEFPTRGIPSPLNYQNSQFYFYFNNIMRSYYVMEVNGSDIRYICTVGGDVYNRDGSPRAVGRPVAVASNSSSSLFLPYLNLEGITEAVMMNQGDNNSYSEFMNLSSEYGVDIDPTTGQEAAFNTLISLNSPYNNVTMTQMPVQDLSSEIADVNVSRQYNVYWNESSPTVYTVDATQSAQEFSILPINMTTRQFLNPMPDDMYKNVRLISKNNIVSACSFGNKLYTGATKTGTDSYTMKSGAESIKASIKVDPKTNLKYLEIVSGSMTYNYNFTYLTLSDIELMNYLQNIWEITTVSDVRGRSLLVKYIPLDQSSGSLNLSQVSLRTILNVPADQEAQAKVNNAVSRIGFDSLNKRYLAMISASDSMYDYFAQDGFVDLETGVLFDTQGITIGYTLQMTDFLALLNELCVSVGRDANNNVVLNYRAPLVLSMPIADSQPAASSSYSPPASSYVPPVPTPPQTLSTGTVNSSPVVNNTPVQNQVQAPVQNQGNPVLNNPVQSNPVQNKSFVVQQSDDPQIRALEKQNDDLQRDTEVRQKLLRDSSLPAHIKQVTQNKITMNLQQIDLNAKKIAALRGNQERSTLLGRLGSKIFSKKTKKSKK